MWPKMAGDRSDRINGRGKRKGHGPPVGRRPWAAPALRRSRHRPLVVLLHGFPGFWYAWRHQIAALANAGYRVVVPDLPGYNTSVKPPRVRDCRPGCWLKRWPTHPKSQTRQRPSSHTPIFSNAVRPASGSPTSGCRRRAGSVRDGQGSRRQDRAREPAGERWRRTARRPFPGPPQRQSATPSSIPSATNVVVRSSGRGEGPMREHGRLAWSTPTVGTWHC